MRIFITLVLAILLGGGGTFLWLYYGGFEGEQEISVAFIDYYVDYEETALEVEQLVHLPGTEGNVDRAELLTLLDSILTKEMDAPHRANLAQLALTNLNTLKQEIDKAHTAQAKLYEVLQELDNASRIFSSIDLRTRAEKIVISARKRAELSANITSILSKNNEQTYAILARILVDEGELSQAHITELNSATAETEKRFSTLEQLYSELVVKKKEVEDMFATFVAVAL
ncbi:TPA: hypothetical protein DEP58_00940 [Patescibacteria group bacterium]|nr:MAG: hypothetical protein UU98_C0006G0002 [Parcubacteria group bacterium GW2011_GWD2_42_14]HCC04855.1 hypothetical protein [Patescibacteria group bacterium]